MEQTDFDSLKLFINKLNPVEDEVLKELSSYFYKKDFKKGDHLITEGDFTNDLFFILKGSTRLYYSSPEGAEHVKSFYDELSVVTSYSALLNQEKSNLNIQCLEDSTLLVGDYMRIRKLNDTDLNLQICARKIAEHEFIKKDSREFQFLTMSAKERYQAFKSKNPSFLNKIPASYLASYLGIRPETLSRIKSDI